MSDIAHFFSPVQTSELLNGVGLRPTMFGKNFSIHEQHFPDLENIDIALIGVCEDRRAITNVGSSAAPDEIRKHLYQLFPGGFTPRIADLGNILPGFEVDDTYFALSSFLHSRNCWRISRRTSYT